MSRAVDKYGINIRNAALQTELANLGINANVQALSQADKAMLRTIVILNSSEYAWGDLADTLGQPANQLRVLQNQISMLGRAIGNIFLPIVAKVLPYLNQLVYALRELAEWIVKLLGFEDFDWGNATGADNSGIADLLDDTEAVADNISDATDNIKEFKRQLQGFDKLNNLTTTDNQGSLDNAKDLANATGLLDEALDSALNRYQEKWDEAFGNMEQRFSQFSNNVKKAYKEGGIGGVGEYFANEIIDGLNNIPWSDYKEKAKTFGENVGKFTAGLLKPNKDGETLFGAVGTAIAESINVAIAGFDGWITEFENGDGWDNLGKNVAQFVGNLIDTTEWDEGISLAGRLAKGVAKAINSFLNDDSEPVKKIGKAAAKLVKMGIEAWYNFVTTLDFSNLGQKIADGINSFLDEMNVKDKKTKKTGWEMLGESISDSITGIADTLITALDNVNWEDVGQAIGDFISAIDWMDIAWKLGKLAKSLLTAAGKAIKGLKKSNPIAASIVALVAGAKLSGLTDAVKNVFSKKKAAFKNGLNDAVSGFGALKIASLAVGIGALTVEINEINKDDTNVLVTAGAVAVLGAAVGVAFGPIAATVAVAISLSMAIADWWFENHYLGKYKADKAAGRFADIFQKDEWGPFTQFANEAVYMKVDSIINLTLSIKNAQKRIKLAVEKIKETLFEALSGTILDEIFSGKFTELAEEAAKNIEKYEDEIEAIDFVQESYNKRDTLLPKSVNNANGVIPGASVAIQVDAKTTEKYRSTMLELKTPNYNSLLTGTGNIGKDLKSTSDLLKTGSKTSTLTGKGKDEGVGGISSELTTGSKTSTLTGKGKDSGVGTIAGKLQTKGLTSTLTGKGNDSGVGTIAGKLQTKGLTSTLTGKGKDGGNLVKYTNLLKTENQSALLTIDAQWKKGTLTGLSAELEKSITKTATNASDYYSVLNQTKKKASGGIWTGSIWKNITGAKRYASGGLPNIGTLFWAGEKGAEIVGNTTRGTEVLNQSQIAQAMAESMESANAQQNAYIRQQNDLLRQQNQLLSAILEKTGITEGEIFSAVRNADGDYRRRNGHGAFAY